MKGDIEYCEMTAEFARLEGSHGDVFLQVRATVWLVITVVVGQENGQNSAADFFDCK